MSLRRWLVVMAGLASLSLAAADWPQWRGINRDGKALDFTAPTAWPTQLTQKWDVVVGDGSATPALVGDKLYVHAREGGDEVLRCLDAATGKEIWQDKHTTQGSTDPGRFVGPRSSPAVAEGKVVSQGARGMLICCDAATGKRLWSKDEIRGWPQFFASSSPIIVDGLAIAQVGGQQNGAVVAYDLTTGDQKWKWTLAGVGPSYASPVLMTAGGTKLIIAQVSDGLVALEAATGKHVWEVVNTSGGSRYKAATPITSGDTLIYLDGPAKAVKLEKEGDKFVAKTQWTVQENPVQFNTPVLRDGLLFGLSGRHDLFCVDTKTGKTAWTSPAPRIGGAAPPPDRGGKGDKGKGKGRGFGGGGMRADAGYGSVVDAGPVLIALTPSAQLIVFEPSDKEFKQLASYKVSDTTVYAYPVVSGNRIYIKDQDSVALWTIE